MAENKDVETIGTRLKKARQAAGLTQNQLAKLSGVSQQMISKLESGKATETAQPHKLAAALGVRTDWLLTGQGPMRKGESNQVSAGPELGIITSVPIVGTTQAGPNKHWIELGYPAGWGEDFVDVPAKDPHAYALRVCGSSMEPRMYEGEIVLVYPSKEAQPGDEVVVRLKDGQTMVKRLAYIRDNRVALDSISDRYHRIEVSIDDIEIMHPVVGVLRPTAIKKKMTN